jgi:hypothetical protein
VQLVADPRQASSSAAIADIQPIQLPGAVRSFGYFIDHRVLRPGDLLLFSQISSNKGSRQIHAAQRNAGFEDEDARWTHAAVHIGDGLLAEAVPIGGIRLGHLFDSINTRLVRARTPLDLNGEQRAQICIKAMTRLGASYSLGYVLKMREFLRSWRLGDAIHDPANANICSMLYHFAFVEAVNALVVPGKPAGVGPAHLSATERLEDVQLNWLRLR